MSDYADSQAVESALPQLIEDLQHLAKLRLSVGGFLFLNGHLMVTIVDVTFATRDS